MDAADLYEYNVVIQAFLYWFYFSVVISIWQLCFALNVHSIQEREEAIELLSKVEEIGQNRRLRGLDLE